MFVLGREYLVPGAPPGTLARFQERLFIRLHRNATDAATWYRLPTDRVIEVGARIQM